MMRTYFKAQVQQLPELRLFTNYKILSKIDVTKHESKNRGIYLYHEAFQPQTLG